MKDKEQRKILELNESMYYACSLCSTENKVVWHKPKTNIWNNHKQHIDLDQTNSELPQYFWCLKHNSPHSLKRDCLPYKAIISYNGEIGNINCTTNQLPHDDVLQNIRNTVSKNSNLLDWKDVMGSNSLPYPCTRESRLILPDIIYCKRDSTTNSAYSITNIIEFETKTAPETIIDKVKRFDNSFKEMVENNYQNHHVLPRIIFLYDSQTEVNVGEIQEMLDNLKTDYLESVLIGYYDNDEKWYDDFFLKNIKF